MVAKADEARGESLRVSDIDIISSSFGIFQRLTTFTFTLKHTIRLAINP